MIIDEADSFNDTLLSIVSYSISLFLKNIQGLLENCLIFVVFVSNVNQVRLIFSLFTVWAPTDGKTRNNYSLFPGNGAKNDGVAIFFLAQHDWSYHTSTLKFVTLLRSTVSKGLVQVMITMECSPAYMHSDIMPFKLCAKTTDEDVRLRGIYSEV